MDVKVPHCVDIWNCRYLDFYQEPMTVYLPLYSTNFVSQFLLWSSIRICLQSSHYEGCHYIFLCCECQSLSMPIKACPKQGLVKSRLWRSTLKSTFSPHFSDFGGQGRVKVEFWKTAFWWEYNYENMIVAALQTYSIDQATFASPHKPRWKVEMITQETNPVIISFYFTLEP